MVIRDPARRTINLCEVVRCERSGIMQRAMYLVIFTLTMFACAPIEGNGERATEIISTDTLIKTPVTTPTPIKTATAAATSVPTATVELPTSTPQTQIAETDGMVLVYIPPGEFVMGDDDSGTSRPQHIVYLDEFWIDMTEVTSGMYALCVTAGVCIEPGITCGENSTYGIASQANFPINCVNWEQARAYCTWAGRRLPTEAEWEKASRGENGRKYPWGNIDPSCALANVGGCEDVVREVGSYGKGVSPYGALDMYGNVSEWVVDWYDSSYYMTSPYDNPTGPDTGRSHVVRGGSDFYSWLGNTVVTRSSAFPSAQADTIGFRCAISQ